MSDKKICTFLQYKKYAEEVHDIKLLNQPNAFKWEKKARNVAVSW